MTENEILRFIASDEAIVEAPRAVAMQSKTIENILVDLSGVHMDIPLPNVSVQSFNLAMEYCAYHLEFPLPPEAKDPLIDSDSEDENNDDDEDEEESGNRQQNETEEKKEEGKEDEKKEGEDAAAVDLDDYRCLWDKEWMTGIVEKYGWNEVFELMKTANYLDIHALLTLSSLHATKKIRAHGWKKTADIHNAFGTKPHFTEEELAEVFKEATAAHDAQEQKEREESMKKAEARAAEARAAILEKARLAGENTTAKPMEEDGEACSSTTNK